MAEEVKEPKAQIVPESQIDFPAQREYFRNNFHVIPIFGLGEIEEIEFNNLGGKENNNNYILDISRERLGLLYGERLKRPFVEQFFYETINSPEVIASLQENESLLDELVPEDLLDSQKIPNNSYLLMLRHHVGIFQKKAEEYKKTVPERLNKFYAAMDVLSEVGFTQEELDIYRKRLKNVDMQLADGLATNLNDPYGTYNPVHDAVSIAEQVPEDKLDEVETHELLHLASGAMFIEKPNILFGFHPRFDREHIALRLRDGLVSGTGETYNPRFMWLNEAITQTLTETITGKNNTNAYFAERVLLAALCQKGRNPIDPGMFFRAYFENYDTDASSNKALPHRKKLMDAIDQSYAPGFLAKLDRFVIDHTQPQTENSQAKNGCEVAFMQMHSDWRVINDYVQDKALPATH